MSATIATNFSAGAVEASPLDIRANAPANDPVTARRSSLFLLYSTKWVSLGRFRLPVWAHVGVLVVDRAHHRATLYDVVSCGARKGARS